MEEWKEYKITDAPLIPLTDLVEFIVDNRGKTVPTAATGIKLIATNCIRNEYLYPLYEKVRYVSEDIYKTWFRSHPKPGDIVFVNKGTPGKCALVPDPVDFCIAQDMMALRLKSDIIYNKYLLAILRSREIQSFIMNNQVGTIIPHFKKEQLKTLMIPLPKMPIQKRIGDLYFNFSEKAEINRRINDNLEQQAQALFKSWFVDFEPFKDQPFVESELGMIPQGWRVECLNEFGKIVCGKTPSKAESSYYGGNIPFVKIPDMHNNIFVLRSEDCLSDLGDKSQVGKRIPPYSVLVSCIATVGLVGMNVRTCHTNQQINTIIPNSIEYRYYLYQKLVSLREYLINLGRGGTATLNVNTRQFGNIRIVRPSDKVLSEYYQRISCLFDKIEINSLESRRLAELRDTLLPRLMSGELKVNDVDA